MEYALFGAGIALGLSAAALCAIIVGFKQGQKLRGVTGLAPLEGAVFGLMGLLLAFTFSGAAERFDRRRLLVVDEANAIGTAYRRLDLLPAATQPPIRDSFRHYVDSRLAIARKLPDLTAAKAEVLRSEALQARIWTLALAASYDGRSPSTTILIINSLNPMFDIANTRRAAARIHPHPAIYILLVIATLLSAVLAGFAMGANQAKSWLHFGAFALMLTVTVYVTIDLEHPRIGLIRMDAMDELLLQERQRMK